MSQIDRAAGVVAKVLDGVNSYTTEAEAASRAAQALADAGLLASDLPEPTDPDIPQWESPSNEHHAVSATPYGTVQIWGDTSGYAPSEAREVAAALLAAAKWAEEQA